VSPGRSDELVVLGRGELDREDSGLAVRVALALPLAGLGARLVLLDAFSTLGLADPPALGRWSAGVVRELESVLADHDTPVLVELESLASLGLADRPLRDGVELIARSEVAAICGSARACLVL